ncbi:MAG TPA: FhaA domain-containing protein [Blastocatellia bacterium]|nr:FhaA domain-containing protein [Blastocatellia bacterium]
MKITTLLGDFRKWLDGEDAATLAPEQPKARSAWEEFLVSVAREVEAVMQKEMFTPPGGPTYIPREYLVFLSREDDAQWQGDKREGLERGLHHVLSERARELVGDKDVQAKSFAVELRVDGTLEKGKFRVQPVWDSSSPKTEVRPRKKSEPPPAEADTVIDEATLSVASPVVADSEATIVRPRAPLFSVSLSRDGGEATVHKFYAPKITIGRGSKDIRVDLKLEGDFEISRKHAVLEMLPEGKFAIICEGRNPVAIDGRELQPGERAEFTPQQKVTIGVWQLQIVSEQKSELPKTEV